MNKNVWKKMKIALAIYALVAGFFAIKDWTDGARQNNKSRALELGSERMTRSDVKQFSLYSDEEIAEEPMLKDVVLLYFPAPSGEKKDFIVFVPGGAYLNCDLSLVAVPGAAVANECGYPAFALKYRVRKYSNKYAPIDDLARALEFIMKNADELNVKTDNYMLTGYSAGGNLVGLFGSKEFGYEKYSIDKPSCLTLVYPWTNINAPAKLSWNIFSMAYYYLGKSLALNVMLGRNADKEEKAALCVQNNIDEDYPPCYIIHGDRDFLVPKELNSDVLVKKLKEKGIRNKYRIANGLSHGFGVGVGTTAEHWIEESIEFWQKP